MPGSRRSVMMMSKAKVGQPCDGRLARLGLFDVIAAVAQLFGDGLPQRRLVFDQQQMFRRVRHLASANILTPRTWRPPCGISTRCRP